MKLNELLENTKMFSGGDWPQVEISEIVTNSLKVKQSSMFVCLEGSRSDGHKYIRDALIRGAKAVVVQRGAEFEIPEFCKDITFIYCDNTRRAAAELYNAWYGRPSDKLNIIAVTGTNGKTSVAFILKAIFEAALYKCGIIGTVECLSGKRRVYANPDDENANMTTPDPKELYRTLAFMVADKVDYVFIEASSHALKLSKLDAISFDSGIFTNLTPEHLDFHGDMDDYKKSKAKLFSMCENSIINADDSACEYMLSKAKSNRFTYSTKCRESDFMATDIVISKNTENNKSNCLGINYNLISKNTIMKIKSPLGGAFNVDNTLCAVACAILHGIAPAVISEALASIFGVNGRMERVKLHKNADFSLYIDYAHTPDALQNLLRSARELVFDGGRIILVFGCGGDRDKSKRALMGQIASQNADFVIITSDNSRSEEPSQIIDGIMSGFDKACDHKVIINRREAIEYAVMNAKPGDLILLAGKGHEKYEIDKSGKHPFDEREISIEAARKRFER